MEGSEPFLPSAEVIAVTRLIASHPQARADQDQGSDAARLVETAGRICYDSMGKGRDSASYHRHILESGHGSVTEHSSLSFHLTMSRGCAQEWTRHRAGCAVSMRSTRFVDESESEWIWHPLLAGLMEPEREALADHARRVYRDIVEKLQTHLERTGVDRATARKQARGAARGGLGNALATEMIWTANLRALRNVLEQRAAPAADAEIRLLANAVFRAAQPYCPEYLGEYRQVESPDGIGFCLVTDYPKV